MKIFISSKIPDEIVEELSSFELNYHDSNETLSREKLMEEMKEADILLCPLSDKIDREMIERAENLKMIANYGAGFDNIDLTSATDRGIVVTNAPAPSSAVSTAELTFALILVASRKLVQGERDLRAGNFHGWKPTYFLGQELRGKTLGIIGMGRIGKNVAKRAEAFEMEVLYYSRNRKEEAETDHIRYAELDEVIEQADILTLHTAFAEELRHMISAEELSRMKDSALFINAARGPLVDEAALANALKNGVIAGAALDVYEFEPEITEELLVLDNVTLLPHLGNATYEARMEMGRAVVDNIKDFAEGKEPRNKVN